MKILLKDTSIGVTLFGMKSINLKPSKQTFINIDIFHFTTTPNTQVSFTVLAHIY